MIVDMLASCCVLSAPLILVDICCICVIAALILAVLSLRQMRAVVPMLAFDFSLVAIGRHARVAMGAAAPAGAVGAVWAIASEGVARDAATAAATRKFFMLRLPVWHDGPLDNSHSEDTSHRGTVTNTAVRMASNGAGKSESSPSINRLRIESRAAPCQPESRPSAILVRGNPSCERTLRHIPAQTACRCNSSARQAPGPECVPSSRGATPS
jgi:hypothetical protein